MVGQLNLRSKWIGDTVPVASLLIKQAARYHARKGGLRGLRRRSQGWGGSPAFHTYNSETFRQTAHDQCPLPSRIDGNIQRKPL